jgi:uncharacterized membrane protein
MEALTNRAQVMNLGLVERWASIVGGVSLITYGVKKGSVAGKLLAVVGGDLVFCGATGYSPLHKALGVRPRNTGESASIPYQQGIRVDADIIIGRPREEVYSFWRKLENLPLFMRHIRSVSAIDGRHSHWVAEGPGGKNVEWNAEIINDQPNELIGWKSLPGSDVDTAGSVHFKPARGGRATAVHVELQYLPPAGAVGAALAKLMGNDPARQVREDLRRLKQAMESAGDAVQVASEGSFPASDPPSWTASEG